MSATVITTSSTATTSARLQCLLLALIYYVSGAVFMPDLMQHMAADNSRKTASSMQQLRQHTHTHDSCAEKERHLKSVFGAFLREFLQQWRRQQHHHLAQFARHTAQFIAFLHSTSFTDQKLATIEFCASSLNTFLTNNLNNHSNTDSDITETNNMLLINTLEKLIRHGDHLVFPNFLEHRHRVARQSKQQHSDHHERNSSARRERNPSNLVQNLSLQSTTDVNTLNKNTGNDDEEENPGNQSGKLWQQQQPRPPPHMSLTKMDVEDVWQLFKCMEGVSIATVDDAANDEESSRTRINLYRAEFARLNLSGPVLCICNLAELRDELSPTMNFGDWQLFHSLVMWLRGAATGDDAQHSRQQSATCLMSLSGASTPFNALSMRLHSEHNSSSGALQRIASSSGKTSNCSVKRSRRKRSQSLSIKQEDQRYLREGETPQEIIYSEVDMKDKHCVENKLERRTEIPLQFQHHTKNCVNNFQCNCALGKALMRERRLQICGNAIDQTSRANEDSEGGPWKINANI